MRRKNQKGFLITLCLCMLCLSGIFGFYQYRRNLSQVPQESAGEQSAEAEELQEPDMEAANSTGAVAKADTEDKPAEEAKIETEEDIYEIGEAELAEADKLPEETLEEETPQESEAEPEEPEEARRTQEDTLLSFADNSSLMWPVEGEVILDYSMDQSIYFATLNQYKYHPAMVIRAQTGEEVWCAARGTVTQLRVDEETGTTLTMSLGNGYEAVYGQLKEVAVQEGDTVEAGALLGYISEPTKYYAVEGSNLYFQLRKDGAPVDPGDYLN